MNFHLMMPWVGNMGYIQRCLQQIGVNNFNQFNIIEMTGMKDMPNYIISLYKDTVWKNRRASFSRKNQ